MNLIPKNQINLYGHKQLFNDLVNLYRLNQFPNKILLSGEKGIGKCTLSYHLINYVLSDKEDFSYDLKKFKINLKNKSFKLIQNKSNPNFYLVDVLDEKKNIDINQIRILINDLNKSSFNVKPRFVLIDNIESLNINSTNALLKILEEPNDNINFILINNNKKVLATLKSRCLNFKVLLTANQSIEITNNILNDNIYNLLNIELINNYNTPGQILRLINLKDKYDLDLKNISLKELLTLCITDKFYKKELFVKELIYLLMELYFRDNISKNNIKLMNIYSYFLQKINNTKRFNLDEEIVFMEFKDKVLDG